MLYIILLSIAVIFVVWLMIRQVKNRKKLIGKVTDRELPKDGSQGRSTFHTGTTTQGGSNHGQGSHALGSGSMKQGSEKTEGSDYKNEIDKFGEKGSE